MRRWRRRRRCRAALDAHPAALAPCHCDPLCENFLDTGERMWIVDWEYSGMNDPLWDLGDLSVEGEFGPEEDEELLAAYFGGAPTRGGSAGGWWPTRRCATCSGRSGG